MGALAGCEARAVLRIERLESVDAVRAAVATARADGYVALKTIAAYRGGLVAVGDRVVAALECNAATGDPLPVQVHTGFGDPDLLLPPRGRACSSRSSSASHHDLRAAALLPVRARGGLAGARLRQRLLRPVADDPARGAAGRRRWPRRWSSRPCRSCLYASDAARTPELYLLGATWWRDALAAVLPELLADATVERAARMILRDNARTVYRL